MRLKYLKRQTRREDLRAAEEEGEAGEEGSDDGGSIDLGSEAGNGDSDDNEDPEQEVRKAWHRDAEPTFDDGPDDGAGGQNRWVDLSPDERLSAAPPAPAAPDCFQGGAAPESGGKLCGGLINPKGFNWEACNFVPRGRVQPMKDALRSVEMLRWWAGIGWTRCKGLLTTSCSTTTDCERPGEGEVRHPCIFGRSRCGCF